MRLSVILAAVLMLGGCGPFRRAKAPPPPPGPIPVRIPDQLTSMAPAPGQKNLPEPPAIATVPDVRPSPAAQMAISKIPALGPPRAARPRRTVRRAVAPATPAAAPAEAGEPAGAPVYRLGELRSADEIAKLRRQTERMIGICGAALAAAEGKTLTAMQAEMVSRVRTFAQQARETMEKDAEEARNLAAKGRTFAEALLGELK